MSMDYVLSLFFRLDYVDFHNAYNFNGDDLEQSLYNAVTLTCR